jgi:hypothetical protein
VRAIVDAGDDDDVDETKVDWKTHFAQVCHWQARENRRSVLMNSGCYVYLFTTVSTLLSRNQQDARLLLAAQQIIDGCMCSVLIVLIGQLGGVPVPQCYEITKNWAGGWYQAIPLQGHENSVYSLQYRKVRSPPPLSLPPTHTNRLACCVLSGLSDEDVGQ